MKDKKFTEFIDLFLDLYDGITLEDILNARKKFMTDLGTEPNTLILPTPNIKIYGMQIIFDHECPNDHSFMIRRENDN